MEKAANITGPAYPMDLQLFADGAPEAGAEAEGTEPQSEETQQEPTTQPATEPSEEPAAEQKPDVTETQAFARRLKEETDKARQKALDDFIDQTYGQSHNIHTFAEYQRALAIQNQQAEVNRLVQQNIPPQYAQEMLENRRFREQHLADQKRMQAQQQKNRQYQDFLTAYPEVASDPSKIPTEVWQSVQKGVSLVDAYSRYENKMLRDQLSKYQTQDQIGEANQANAATSTGSAKGTGKPVAGYIPKEVFEANKGNQDWLSKNYDTLIKSMKKWGK